YRPCARGRVRPARHARPGRRDRGQDRGGLASLRGHRRACPAASTVVDRGEPMTIRVLVVDDHPVVRAGLVGLLSSAGDLEVVGEAGDGKAGVGLAASLAPDVVLMDLRMPRLDGAGATAQIVESLPETRVVVLTT